ncbi:hypothetical protein [Malikia spinosa]|uniref:hypothetical protein n=1 Tax=Malikia spinosa TaxID=86180 RepID=UPI001F2CF2DA|nr:hypothetical protein [Malikia spinosa]
MSLDLLQQAVGPEGRVIAIDQSTEMLEQARQPVARGGWGQGGLVRSPNQPARLPARAPPARHLARQAAAAVGERRPDGAAGTWRFHLTAGRAGARAPQGAGTAEPGQQHQRRDQQRRQAEPPGRHGQRRNLRRLGVASQDGAKGDGQQPDPQHDQGQAARHRTLSLAQCPASR